jgi:hypothetical protein
MKGQQARPVVRNDLVYGSDQSAGNSLIVIGGQ